jgi:hypothetical protein
MAITHYPTALGRMFPIDKMSIPYLKSEIARIKRTDLDTEYLPALEAELKKRTIKTFKIIK